MQKPRERGCNAFSPVYRASAHSPAFERGADRISKREPRRMNESVLAEQTHHFVRSQRWQAAVLPFGATEPHNLHMPYGTDNFQVEELGRRACARAWSAGAKVALLPTIPYGV